MKYTTYLKTLKGCPFCSLEKKELLASNAHALLILAQAPYTRDHLLVIPRKHATMVRSLTPIEKKAIDALIRRGMNGLHKKYTNVTLLYREGNPKEVGKSIQHMHYHLIPNMQIGPCDIDSNARYMYSDEVYRKMTNTLKKRF